MDKSTTDSDFAEVPNNYFELHFPFYANKDANVTNANLTAS